jgi:carboxymethylenebutenolidase
MAAYVTSKRAVNADAQTLPAGGTGRMRWCRGGAAYLRGLEGSNGKVGVIGYCAGGRQSFLAACSLQLVATVDCYGACIVNPPPEGMPLKVQPIVGLAKDLSCPML